MTDTKNWFEVDRKGLAKLVERRDKVGFVHELISNSCDADGTTTVNVSLVPEEGVPKVWLTVSDDSPNGFADLRHAFTLYAESSRKADASKRGRFNLGEKLVLALCDEATIVTTTGGVMFDHRGRTTMRTKRAAGSEFSGLARITRAELAEILTDLKKIIPPAGITITINNVALPVRTPLKSFEATLPTEIADAEGVLRRTARKCTVNVYEPLDGEVAMLYELGIPVVETGDRWHVEAMQKVPLNTDRDNVTPAYLREIRTLIVNAMHDKLDEADANATFVNEALADKDASPEAIKRTLDLKYGEKRAIWDASDLEANMNLISDGYTLIKGAQLTGEQWKNAKRDPMLLPSGQIRPTKKAMFSLDGEDKWVPEEKWTDGMRRVVGFSKAVARALLGFEISVGILSDIRETYGACYGQRQLTFNLGRLGHAFFNDGISDRVNDLLLHELAHEKSANHLDERYHEALSDLGARLTRLALTNPEIFLARV